MTEWRPRPISDLCTHVVDCVNKTAPISDVVTPFKMLRTANVRDGWIETSNTRRVDEEVYERWTRRMRPQRGDVILTREAPLGEVGMLRTDESVFLGQRLVMYRADPAECDPHFLLYSMLGPSVQAELRSLGSGATVEHLRVPDCEKLTIPCPALPIQQRIGAVLSSLDALVENNRRRVEVLEEMARAIYREWFVHFRYPGHATVSLAESPLGSIPDGWERVQLADLVSTQYGYTESASDTELGPHYLRGMDINKRSYIDWSSLPYCSIDDEALRRFRIQVGDVFVIRMADPGKVGICEVETNAVFASYLVRLRPSTDRISPYFLFFTLSADEYQGWVTGASTGATRKSVSAKVMTEPRIVLAPNHVQQEFEGVVLPMRLLMARLVEQNSTLTTLRDKLLPRLVTGQIDVSSLDIDALIEDSVA